MAAAKLRKVLVANRGEIAVRILRAVAASGARGVAIHSEDDARCLHVRQADEVAPLSGRGARAYLDVEAVLAVARERGCDAIHPGYGFLAERADFARACEREGVTFVGPAPEVLDVLGDKSRARALAASCDVPILRGTEGPTSAEEVRALFEALGPGSGVVIKAIAGGGGRGMRVVTDEAEIEDAHARCRREAEMAFGRGDVYAEALVHQARHLEVQVVGDGEEVAHLWERECTLQRRHQKLVELAPSPGLDGRVREALLEGALRMARAVGYRGLGTFEFLLDGATGELHFIEANPRLQVEHTVTEEVTGIDLVRAQLALAAGRRLADLSLRQRDVPPPRGHAVQVRVNMEKVAKDGSPRPSSGTLSVFEVPSGPGVRVDHCGYAGYRPSPGFDGLLAKVVAHAATADSAEAIERAYRALCDFRIEGIETNLGFLRSLLRHPDVVANRVTTRFIETHAASLLGREGEGHPERFFRAEAAAGSADGAPDVGARVDSRDPLAVLEHGRRADPDPRSAAGSAAAEGAVAVPSPVQGTVVSVGVTPGARVRRGEALLVIEAMKMEHVVAAPTGGEVRRVAVAAGDTVPEGRPLLFLAPGGDDEVAAEAREEVDLDRIRPDLAEALERHAVGRDERRPEAVARRRKTGQRTARENVADLCDPGSFVEYAPLVIAAQRRRRELDDLIRNTPADGLVAGVGSVNGDLFPDADARCIAMSYDYTVLAGTQGLYNHRKKDRMFELAERHRLPVVLFSEGGGGRPGDTDGSGVAGLDCLAFQYFARLSGLVPLVGINSGRCFAGNAALLGCCDVVIATANSNIGMGGPAMIEGGGLGVFRPEEVGPMEVQVPNGVVDVAVEDEAEAVAAAKQYLSYFQGALPGGSCPDQRRLRSLIPENRLRVYDVREVVRALVDDGSLLELRRGFGHGMVTALARIEGRPLGIVANNPMHLAGAIDRDGADKASRFMQLCDAFDVPLLFLCDTPGIMVGPESEKTALVRHASRMFVTGASLTVPFFTIVLRKGYGLGAQAMAGGSFRAPFFTVAWPTGEFGGMGLEGAVKLGYRKELEARTDPEERRALFEEMVARMYEHGKAVSMASYFEIDDVIDPAESRTWILRALRSVPPTPPRTGRKRPCVDPW